MFIEGEIPNVVTTTGNGNYGNNGGFFNGDGIWAIILFAMIFGRNGGIFGNNGSGVGDNYVLATDFATIERKLDGVNNGLCDGFYAQNTNMLNGFAAIQQTLCQGFSGVNSTIVNNGYETRNAITNGFNVVNQGICNLGYNLQGGLNSLSHQISDCCCELKTMNLENRYLNEKQTCDIVNAINAGNQRLVDIYTGDKIAALQTENASLKAQISNDKQSAYLLSELKPCPSAAYIVPNPNCCYDYSVVRNNGCGCC